MFHSAKFLSLPRYLQSVPAKYSNYISYKYNIQINELNDELKTFAEHEMEEMKHSVNDDYKNFVDKNENELNEEFAKEHKFQTDVRGIKVRGVFPTQQEAELRCKMLREVDPNHDVYIGQVGVWMPFHPEAYKTGKVEYLEKELNDLMNEKQKNEQAKPTNKNRKQTKRRF